MAFGQLIENFRFVLPECLVNAVLVQVKCYFTSPVTRLTRQVELLPSCRDSRTIAQKTRNVRRVSPTSCSQPILTVGRYLQVTDKKGIYRPPAQPNRKALGATFSSDEFPGGRSKPLLQNWSSAQ